MTQSQSVLDGLVERLGKATGRDRELDRDIMVAAFGPGVKHALPLPAYTASVDADLALVERMLPGWQIAMGTCGENDTPWACLTEPEDPCRDFASSAPDIPIAILLATLSALKSLEAL